MMRSLLTGCLLLLAQLAAGAALADGKPVLRSQVVTLSDIVTVGDFYSNAGDLASAPLFRSPDMGTSGDVQASLVADRARAAGLKEAGTDGLRTVVVHRGATVFDHSRIDQFVRNAIADSEAGTDAKDLEITFYQVPERIVANPAAPEPVQAERIDWTRKSGQFSLYVRVAGETGTQTLNITGRAVEMVEVAAVVQPLRRGDIVRQEDLGMVRLPRSTVPANALIDASEVVGLAAKANLRPEAPLTRNDFERPLLISRGDKITVTYELPGMILTARAQAMENGAKGDVIDIMNLQSRRIVPGIVSSRGQVRVQSAAPIVASLNNEAN